MLVLNISIKEAEWLKGELEGCRDMALDRLNDVGDDENEVVMLKDEIKTLDHVLEKGLDNNWVRRGEFVERILSYAWEHYSEATYIPGNFEEVMDDMGLSTEEVEEVFNSLGYMRD